MKESQRNVPIIKRIGSGPNLLSQAHKTTFGTSPKDKINLTHYKIGFNASTSTLEKLKEHKVQMVNHKKSYNLKQGTMSSAASVKRVTMATLP
jgi:hypothetical protein